MAHAWLDSLSEDWVSQPASEASIPAFADSVRSAKQQPSAPSVSDTGSGSRIPRPNSAPRKSQNVNSDNSSNILSERSQNDINLPSPRRAPSKLSQEIKMESRGRYASRSVSASTMDSVVHNTVNHKAHSLSPIKSKGQTPEWKRRLVYGEVSYGEHRDLFTSAGTGLENIFKPPKPTEQSGSLEEESLSDEPQEPQHEVTLPSSPPLYSRDPSTVDIHVDESVAHGTQHPQPNGAAKGIRYRMTDDSGEASRLSDSGMNADSVTNDVSRQDTMSYHSQGSLQDNAESRKVSGQSVLRNEDFSPIPITHHNGADGKMTFAPLDLPAEELRKRLEKLRRNQMLSIPEPIDEAQEAQLRVDEKSLNINNTKDYEQIGGFINFRRGGRSADGSFRHRLLSSALGDTSELLPEESLQASTPKQFPSIRTLRFDDSNDPFIQSPSMPRVPHPSPVKKDQARFVASKNSRKQSLTTDAGASDTALGRGAQSVSPTGSPRTLVSNQDPPTLERFGTGSFDGYEFREDFTFNSEMEDKENHGPMEDSVQLPQQRIFDQFHNSSPSDGEELVVQRRRGKSDASSSSRTSNIAVKKASQTDTRDQLGYGDDQEVLATPRRDTGSEGKRPRTSPSKDPTPKRRRTLHKSDIAYGVEVASQGLDSVQLSHQQMQSIMGKKRKDARPGDNLEMAHPSVMAARQVLRPRTPTPSQRSSVQRERAPLAELERPDTRSPTTARSARAGMPLMETDRKPSIKTEDFINEANKIMAMIRSKAGLGSGLASLEESEAEHGQAQFEEDSFQESTKEPFSRPPSREGRPALPRMSARQEDPELARRLKQYEEASDMGDIISSSIRSMAAAQEAIREVREASGSLNIGRLARGVSLEGSDEISDPPNIRISQNPRLHQQSSKDSLRDGVPSNGSGSSRTHSTTRSIPTGSSTNSDTRRTIAPQNVAHLIPEQVGSMVFDKENNIWVKRKKYEAARNRHNVLPSEGSEGDPFAGIPDLSVDMTMEMHNLRRLAARQEAMQSNLETSPSASPTRLSAPGSATKSALRSPSQHARSASASPSRFEETDMANDEDVEHEIKLHEDRLNTPKRNKQTISFSSPIASIIQDAVREEASMFDESQSMAEQSLGDISGMSETSRQRRVSSSSTGRRSGSGSRSRSVSRGPARHLSVRGQAFVPRPVSRIDERDEEVVQELRLPESRELSVIGDRSLSQRPSGERRQTSVSFILSTPARPTEACPAVGVDPGPVIGQVVGTLSLSPLSEFTFHHGEESLPLEVSYVVGNHHLVTGDQAKRVVSMNTQSLVEKLAEVQPFEPYWDDMQQLDVRDKSLESLHGLDEFCGQLVSLDASRNAIRNLSGIPASVRQLNITNNQLTSLTSWDALMNLQYVDISNNALTSLSCLKSLVHLRSLRVDNNQLTSLDGLKYHDGLQSLRARGNRIEHVDFDGTNLTRLTELDLKGNQIASFSNVEQLTSLSVLNLEDNKLANFAITSEASFVSLKYLKLGGNNLESLDIKQMPHLRLLHADRNCLSQITGISRARRIDSLSLREQRGKTPLDSRFLSSIYEVRKLYLSGNLIEKFEPQVDFLNLQLLEMANCGLQSLPDHLGEMLPNLRVLNISSNALEDLGPLRYIPRLKHIFAAGNRLADCAAAVDVLSGFPHLATADLRGNPLAQGFYPPLQVLVRPGEERPDAFDPFRLPEADAALDAAYASRLDLGTRMRRRLYEQVFASSCRRLKVLDGLAVDREAGTRRDAVWTALAAQGLVVVPAGLQIEAAGEEQCVEKVPESGCWEAENSFA